MQQVRAKLANEYVHRLTAAFATTATASASTTASAALSSCKPGGNQPMFARDPHPSSNAGLNKKRTCCAAVATGGTESGRIAFGHHRLRPNVELKTARLEHRQEKVEDRTHSAHCFQDFCDPKLSGVIVIAGQEQRLFVGENLDQGQRFEC
jgi:hypothetical protein